MKMIEDGLSSQLSRSLNSGINMINKSTDETVSSTQYSMPGILHFIQTEWARFEMERSQWAIERAELQAQIAFLKGERTGQENLKQDLVRRIKMLEYALKQERTKYHKLKYGNELIQSDLKFPSFEKKDNDEKMDEILPTCNANINLKQGRQLLRQYLREIGYTDTILDVRSVRVKSLLGLQNENKKNAEINNRPSVVNGDVNITDYMQQRSITVKGQPAIVDGDLADTEDAVMANFDFLNDDNNLLDGDTCYEYKNEENEMDDALDTLIESDQMDLTNKVANDTMVNVDEIYLENDSKNFNYISGQDLEVRSHGDSPEWDKHDYQSVRNWNSDGDLHSNLKDEFQKARQGKKGQLSRPKRSDLQAMLASLSNEDDAVVSNETSTTSLDSEANMSLNTFPVGNTKALLTGSNDDQFDNILGLGELADLTVSNDEEISLCDASSSNEVIRKIWQNKYTLRSHFDCIRALAFHPEETFLVTASEDGTLKLWNLQRTVPAKKGTSLDVEPVCTFRGHCGPVLSLVMSSNGERFYSGGVDATIKCWTLPNVNIDPYDSYDSTLLHETLTEHSDSVCGLAVQTSTSDLLSCSTDGTVKLWKPNDTSCNLVNTYQPEDEDGLPTSVDFIKCEQNKFLVSYTSANIYIFDMDKVVSLIEVSLLAGEEMCDQINRVLSHPSLPVTIAAHEDKHIRFFDNVTGDLIHSMVAHQDAVTSLAVDPNGLYLISGSHDGSVRLWNLDTKTCSQEITSHRKKFDEAIHDVAFHPSKPFFASAGADALCKVFV